MPEAAPVAGTRTFLFTDIVGSTALWEHAEHAMSAALPHHDALLRNAIETHRGVVFKTVGDSFCAAFACASDAVSAAIAVRCAVREEDWHRFGPDMEPLAVRMAVHTGDAESRGGDFFGPALNRVARLTAEAETDQILISLVTQQLVRDRLPSGTQLRDLGEWRLKDLVHAEHVFEVIVAGPSDCSSGAMAGGGASSLRPDQLRDLASGDPSDLASYLVGRVAGWSLPQYRLDDRFVRLALLVDQGEGGVGERWAPDDGQHAGLHELLTLRQDPAFVLLGPPGSGKSTLLRRLELDLARGALSDDGPNHIVPFFTSLSQYHAREPGASRPAPDTWLATVWRERYPRLPGLLDLLRSGRVVLLLDALNEIPASGQADFHEAVASWRGFLQEVIAHSPGSRAVFSCRSLDFSAPLSSPRLPVPQARIEPLSDDQVRLFLELYSPLYWQDVWGRVRNSAQLDLLRSPYFLKLLTAQVEAEGHVPEGRAGLFTGFARQALLREIERGNPLFRPEYLLTGHDLRHVVNGTWRSPNDLPSRGPLFPSLEGLAHQMQCRRYDNEAAQVRLDYDDALALLPHGLGEAVLGAAIALSIMDEDAVTDEVSFVHQLVQEYMAARHIATDPDAAAGLVRVPWIGREVRPSLEEVKALIAPADPLPALPATGWAETAVMAAAMADNPDSFVEHLRATNLVVAARCAVQAEVHVSELTKAVLRTSLLARCRDPEADVRARIDAALVLGDLGDPRFVARSDAGAIYIAPEIVVLHGGAYPIGRSDTTASDESPQHKVELAGFGMAVHPVTNSEYGLFMTAGGYDDQRWWDTDAARRWQRGEGTAEGSRAAVRFWHAVFLQDPARLDGHRSSGRLDDRQYELWQGRLRMSEAALDEHLREKYPSGPLTEPLYWRDSAYNRPTMPVVGVGWFEAHAYASWLATESGRTYRLPSEAEWEAAARGIDGRTFAFGCTFDPAGANTAEAHLRRPTPVGVFPSGDTPEGLADMTGNVWEWTSSLYGRRLDRASFAYPYTPGDGREDLCAGPEVCRVARGGSWFYDAEAARATTRYTYYPDGRNFNLGFRLAMDVTG